MKKITSILILLFTFLSASYKQIPLPVAYVEQKIPGKYDIYFEKKYLPAGRIISSIEQPLTRGILAYSLFHAKKYQQKKVVLYDDIAQDHWLYPYLYELNEKDIIKGFPDNNFYPDKQINRADAGFYLIKSLNLPFNLEQKTMSYRDVPEDHWSYDVVLSLYNYELIKEQEYFYPDKIITVEEYLEMFHILLKD